MIGKKPADARPPDSPDGGDDERDGRVDDDRALSNALSGLLRRVDACPVGLVEDARTAPTWPLGEAELAALLGDAPARD